MEVYVLSLTLRLRAFNFLNLFYGKVCVTLNLRYLEFM